MTCKYYTCSSLTSITIPNNITELPCYYEFGYNYGFFEDCSSLTSVTIPNSVTSIGAGAFRNCSSLTSITIPNSVTSIGDRAFRNCSSLTSMTIDMTSIPNTGLNTASLQNLTIGENVTSIGSGAFNGCSFLQNVTCLATIPPTLADNTVFPYPNIASLTVPCGTLEAYSSATSFWNMFFMGRISEDGYNVVATANDNVFGSVAVANDCSTATLTATANEGYVFLSWNDGNTENPRLVSLTSDTSFVANFIVSTVNTDISATICQGQTYTENGFNVSEAGVYTQNITSVNGCDSIVTLTLNVNPIYNTELTATICQGQTYT
ncbi:MAG: leucine-rich repeat domain-containing protein, partial [Bacteroidales bacterium]|nr:leucine-rich repeat domain-containing protein [Bacteroidales bacterium]